MAIYLKDSDLYYQIKLSKGKGYLTPTAQNMLILIVKNMITVKQKYYKTEDDFNDIFQSTVLHVLTNWKGFNPDKYDIIDEKYTDHLNDIRYGYHTDFTKESWRRFVKLQVFL
jgi:hypothetical protein